MAKTGDIQRRIKSVGNIKKITKAMEMVSAAKMRRAIEAVLRTRTYANLSWETVINIARVSAEKRRPLHPLLSKRDNIKRVGIIIIASNRGLCAGFNSHLLAKIRHSIKKYQQIGEQAVVETELIIIGKKAEAAAKWGFPIAAEFAKNDLASGVGEVTAAAKLVTDEFLSGHYDKIMVAYNDFVSASRQIPRVKQLLPVDLSTKDTFLGVVGKSKQLATDVEYIEAKTKEHLSVNGYRFEYKFEPSPEVVLDKLLPKLIEVQLLQALLESNASEHSARMSAMHQATSAAGDMAAELTLFYNKARQAGITAEIAEISAGANVQN